MDFVNFFTHWYEIINNDKVKIVVWECFAKMSFLSKHSTEFCLEMASSSLYDTQMEGVLNQLHRHQQHFTKKAFYGRVCTPDGLSRMYSVQ